jgi:hypothetical protein
MWKIDWERHHCCGGIPHLHATRRDKDEHMTTITRESGLWQTMSRHLPSTVTTWRTEFKRPAGFPDIFWSAALLSPVSGWIELKLNDDRLRPEQAIRARELGRARVSILALELSTRLGPGGSSIGLWNISDCPLDRRYQRHDPIWSSRWVDDHRLHPQIFSDLWYAVFDSARSV